MEAKIYNQKGKESGTIKLPKEIFGLRWSGDLVHQVITSMLSNMRTIIADTKGRGEVSGGGKKPWKQKGTGRARHGSIRSPIWKGGGVTHGPLKEKNYKKKINKKMKARALFVALSKKLKSKELFFVDKLDFGEIKTKKASEFIDNLAHIPGLEKISRNKSKRLLANILILKKDEVLNKSFRNIPVVDIKNMNSFNVLDILERKFLIIVDPEKVIKSISLKNK